VRVHIVAHSTIPAQRLRQRVNDGYPSASTPAIDLAEQRGAATFDTHRPRATSEASGSNGPNERQILPGHCRNAALSFE
jgi:hypothetical protein